MVTEVTYYVKTKIRLHLAGEGNSLRPPSNPLLEGTALQDFERPLDFAAANPNETKMSCHERERASLRVDGF